jgi:hypothetical protein
MVIDCVINLYSYSFRNFPWTKGFAATGYILNPLKRWGWVLELLPDLITILVIILCFAMY